MTRRILLLIALFALATSTWAQQKPAAPKVTDKTPESAKAPKIKAANIQVMRPVSEELTLPDDFRMAIYEKVIDDLVKSERFQHVYRDGETISPDVKDLVKFDIIIWGFKEGSARMRQVTTVMGATKINVRVRATDATGKELMDRNAEGDVHFFGENLHATDILAGNIAKLVKQTFDTGLRVVK